MLGWAARVSDDRGFRYVVLVALRRYHCFPWFSRSSAKIFLSSPLSCMFSRMSHPPMNSPLTKICGMVGQLVNCLMPSRRSGSSRTFRDSYSTPEQEELCVCGCVCVLGEGGGAQEGHQQTVLQCRSALTEPLMGQ